MKNTLLHVVKEAAKIAKREFERPKQVKEKKGASPSLVTSVDLKCNTAIIKEIKKKFPKHNILSEETGKENNGSDYTWYIDPIDGTHNFARKIPLYGISVALGHKNNILIGAIAMPYFNHTYFAEKGRGAFKNSRKISVSKKKELNFYMVGFDFPPAKRHHSLGFLNNIKEHIVDIRDFGCAVYQAALLAEGKLDAYVIQKTNSWDIAAGFLIIEEAGGKVTNFEGKKWNLNDNSFVATNGLLHKEILECVRSIK